MDEALRERIVEFVQHRNEMIRKGDRPGLDATYYGLNHRNKYNCHDYDWYLHMIEQGYGGEIQRIDIVPIPTNREDPLARLPFEGSNTYSWPPQYKVFVQTIDAESAQDRKTLWLVSELRSHDDCDQGQESCLKVVLPMFAGRTKDEVARGEFTYGKTELPVGNVESQPKFAFTPEKVVELLINDLVLHVILWKRRLVEDTIRAIVLDFMPWHGTCYFEVLTTKEDFNEAEYGKWDIGGWRYHEDDDSEFVSEGIDILIAHYKGDTLSDQESAERVQDIYLCLARALKSGQVKHRLKGLDLAPDFEFAVFHPDDPSYRNFCDLIS